MAAAMKRFISDEAGQGMAEYGLILAMVALGLTIALGTMKNGIANAYQSTVNGLN